MERIEVKPAIEDFKLLAEHQAQTPETFFASKPVLHAHAISAISTADHAELQRLEHPVDVFVSSRYLTIYSDSSSFGFNIPYPAITVTAQDGADVLLEINLSDQDTADEDIEFLQLRITPERIEKHGEEQAEAGAGHTNGTTSTNDTSTALYKAISDCQELNPDPRGEDEEDGDGGFDETAPGATGWITSENMADFMDEEGNFNPQMAQAITVVGEDDGGLGAGAGTRRTAGDRDQDDDDDQEETKWQRTT